MSAPSFPHAPAGWSTASSIGDVQALVRWILDPERIRPLVVLTATNQRLRATRDGEPDDSSVGPMKDTLHLRIVAAYLQLLPVPFERRSFPLRPHQTTRELGERNPSVRFWNSAGPIWVGSKGPETAAAMRAMIAMPRTPPTCWEVTIRPDASPA